MSVGLARDFVTFEAFTEASDGIGGTTRTWVAVEPLRISANVKTQRGKETIENGAIQNPQAIVLKVRSSSVTRTITEAHRALINGQYYNIRSIENPDRRSRFIEMVLEKGTPI